MRSARSAAHNRRLPPNLALGAAAEEHERLLAGSLTFAPAVHIAAQVAPLVVLF
jgi:hypothetical protein